MKISLPDYIYKEFIDWKNYISQELISEQEFECTWRIISKNWFTWYELEDVNESLNKILVILKKTSSKILNDYTKILLIEKWDLIEENFINNKNTYKWYKHSNIVNKIEINNTYLESIKKSWKNFKIIEENKELWIDWLRKPQIWALYSILSNYTINDKTFTVVMPTWTWKTETMLAALLKLKIDRLIVIVPTDALREQISLKFIKLWIFEKLKMIDWTIKKPIVWVLKKKLENIGEFVSKTNVIISTINIIWWLPEEKQKELWINCSHLFIDEAHHTPAKTWKNFKKNFWEANIIQFTATPFRNDKKRIEWKIIYNYPLKKAQEEEYFKNIIFKPILEPNSDLSDKKIRDEAIKQLEDDISNWYDHILMARCKDIETSQKIYDNYYNTIELQKYNPILIHSKIGLSKRQELLNKLKKQESKIVVCVDMLWEWYDLPNLKIAALHYAHRSLWITMQFIWRFTRVSWLNLWNATFIANITDSNFWDSLKEMYSENSDWNTIISKESSLHIEKQVKFQEFIDWFDNLDIDISSIKAPLSSVFYKEITNISWSIENIEKCLNENFINWSFKYSINEEHKLVVVIEETISTPNFWSIKELKQVNYILHIFCYDNENKLFYILSDVDSRKDSIIKSFWWECRKITEDDVFKSFDKIDFLQLFIVWLKDDNWNIKYRMHAGIDIKSQLTQRDQINKVKSNIFGFWFDKWVSTSIWASRKWKVWAKLNWNIIEWKEWCIEIGKKLKDPTTSWDNILDWVMNIEKIDSIPNEYPISIDWNEEVYMNYDRIYFKLDDSDDLIWVEKTEIKLFKITIEWIENDEDTRKKMQLWELKFSIYSEWIFNIEIEWKIEWDEDNKKMVFNKIEWDDILIVKWAKVISIIDYLNLNYPIIKYSNWEYLEWIYLRKPDYEIVWYNIDNISTIDWKGLWVDIKKESKIKNWVTRVDSIQNKIIEDLKNSWKYNIIFNDDGSWEIADVVWIIYDESSFSIKIELYHCKYSWWDEAWARLWDLYEVCWQTQRSVRWSHLESTLNQIIKRWWDNPSKYEFWDINTVSTLIKVLPFCKIEREFFIVQPWLSKEKITDEQKKLLETTEIYLKTTFNIPMKVIASE